MQDLNKLYDKAYEFAKNAHKGQKRWSGSDYFENHVKIVSDNIPNVLNEIRDLTTLSEEELKIAKISALLHDVVEDTPVTNEDIRNEFGKEIAYIVSLLTKTDSYLEYILDLCKGISDEINGIRVGMIACIVKLSDLKHNVSDLKPGSMKDKYELSLALILTYINVKYQLQHAMDYTNDLSL